MNIQVRSEETGLGYFNTMEEAFGAAVDDKTIWKISFILPNGKQMRFVSHERYHGHDCEGTWELEEVTA